MQGVSIIRRYLSIVGARFPRPRGWETQPLQELTQCRGNRCGCPKYCLKCINIGSIFKCQQNRRYSRTIDLFVGPGLPARQVSALSFAPEERYVYRAAIESIPALQRSAMCIARANHHNPTPAGRQVSSIIPYAVTSVYPLCKLQHGGVCLLPHSN